MNRFRWRAKLASVAQAVKGAPRLYYLCTADHRYTFDSIAEGVTAHGVVGRAVSYERLLRKSALPCGTYVFTDFDRLSSTELTAAAAIYRRLRAAGVRVLNDPAKVLRRDELIQWLYTNGLGSFRSYRPSLDEVPEKFPVFLRTITGHRGVLSGLLHDARECEEALRSAMEQGYPVIDLAFIEYAAEPDPETGHFKKQAAFFIDGRVIPANSVNDRSWIAKIGESNLAPPEFYAKERAEMDAYPHEDWVRRVFGLAQIDFGRIDFGMVAGQPQAYEINTNPMMERPGKHANPDRTQTVALLCKRLAETFAGIASSPDRGAIDIRTAYLRRKRRRPGPRRI